MIEQKIKTGPLLKDCSEPLICHFVLGFFKSIYAIEGFLNLFDPRMRVLRNIRKIIRNAAVGPEQT